MPNFGFNPFAPRVNVYTTGVESGDARRYHSRNVIRTGGEKVEIDATLTPGEAGKHQKTRFEQKITEMVEKEREFAKSQGKKLEFVNGEKIKSSEVAFFGLKTHEEYIQLKKESKRREELSLYQLTEKEIEDIIIYERNSDKIHQDSTIKELYKKIALQKAQYEITHSIPSRESIPLHERVDQSVDDFLTFQRIRNPLLIGHSNKALQKAEEGIVDSHIEHVNMTAMLDEVEREFVKQHPIIKEEVNEMKRNALQQEILQKRVKVSKEQFNNVNVPLSYEKTLVQKTPKQTVITPLKRKPKLKAGVPNPTLCIRNLPKQVTCQELVELFGMFEAEDKKLPRIKYSLLTGRMKGQAFVTFGSTEIATKVFSHYQAFQYKGKVLDVQYKNG